MNNPITDVVRGLGDSISGVFTGTNPLFAPQITNIFGFTIPGVPVISARDYFITQMESWLTSKPLKKQWNVLIQRYPKALTKQT
jgi:hypothetical protein